MNLKWAKWMMNETRKMQPKSANFVAASFQDILSWFDYAWKSVKKETILSEVERCFMSTDTGKGFEVDHAPEKWK